MLSNVYDICTVVADLRVSHAQEQSVRIHQATGWPPTNGSGRMATYKWQCTGRPPTQMEYGTSIVTTLMCTRWRAYAHCLDELSLTAPLKNEQGRSTFT